MKNTRDTKDLLNEILFEPLRPHLSTIRNRQFKELREPIGDSVVRWLKKVTPDVDFNCSLSGEDRRLICCWSNRSKYSKIPQSIVDRLESARKSELASIEYYRQLGSEVRDISIGQLVGNLTIPNEWKTHDLLVDGRPLDVKSTRRFYGRVESVHYFIKKTKRDNANNEIGFAGVVAKIGKTSLILSSMVNGECYTSHIKELKTCFAELYPGFFEFSGDFYTNIPGWMYEFPDVHYDTAYMDLETAFRSRPELAYLGGPALQFMLTLSPFYPGKTQTSAKHDTERIYAEKLTDEERRFIDELLRVSRRTRLTRRSLYLFLLVYALSLAERKDDFEPVSLRRLLFLSTSLEARSYPLGLFDPLHCVWDLITVLSKILKYHRDVLLKMSRFRMYNATILRGYIDRRFRTVLAYCGNCGKYPIYWGRSKSCEKCSYLICDECHFCSDYCV